MADHPLRPATHHRLGEPLPLQLANGTQSSLTALIAFIIIGCPIIIILGISIRFQMLSLAVRQVLYALLTRPPPKPKLKTQIQVDLHVLSILSAFILSQDQTLRSIFPYSSFLLSFLFHQIYGCFLSFLYSVANVLVTLTSIILTLFLDFVNNIFQFFLNFLLFFLAFNFYFYFQ